MRRNKSFETAIHESVTAAPPELTAVLKQYSEDEAKQRVDNPSLTDNQQDFDRVAQIYKKHSKN